MVSYVSCTNLGLLPLHEALTGLPKVLYERWVRIVGKAMGVRYTAPAVQCWDKKDFR